MLDATVPGQNITDLYDRGEDAGEDVVSQLRSSRLYALVPGSLRSPGTSGWTPVSRAWVDKAPW